MGLPRVDSVFCKYRKTEARCHDRAKGHFMEGRDGEYKPGSHTARVQIPAQPLRNSGSLGKSLNFSGLRVSSCKVEGENKRPSFSGSM